MNSTKMIEGDLIPGARHDRSRASLQSSTVLGGKALALSEGKQDDRNPRRDPG